MRHLVFAIAGCCGAIVLVTAVTQGCGLLGGIGGYAQFAIEGGAPDVTPEVAITDSGVVDVAEVDAPCVPDDDADCNGKCGELMGRCNVVLACGGCPVGEACGGGGNANVCGMGSCVAECTAKPCGASDGCSSVCTSGFCVTGLACAAGTCKCTPATCSGCCSADGVCHTGVGGPSLCGQSGAACTPAPPNGVCDNSCGGNGQVCCVGDAQPACGAPLSCGGSGQPGICGCTPNCATLADGGPVACGASDGCGGLCQSGNNACPVGQRCVNGGVCACDPTSCTFGCCSGSKCVADGGEELCGSGGAVCAACAAGDTCHLTCGNTCGAAGQACCGNDCVAPLTCQDGGCGCVPDCVGKSCGQGDGCGGICVDGGQQPTLTGCPPGAFCPCPAGGSCSPTTAACGCDPTSCGTGCCVSGECVNGDQGNVELCGTGGAACVACPAGYICSGTCVPPDAGD